MAIRILWRWLPLAILASAACVLVYLGVQQSGRHAANDPQLQMARDLAAQLGAGEAVASVMPERTVDYSWSLDPFVTVFDDRGAIVASSGRLRGVLRALPEGVLDHVRQTGEERVTWQPEPGVRIAAVIDRYAGSPGGFVLVGRSLLETEQRAAKFASLLTVAWFAILGGLLVIVAGSEVLIGHRRAPSSPS